MSFYDATVPAFLQILNSLSGLLTKAEAHCAAKNIKPEVLLSARAALTSNGASGTALRARVSHAELGAYLAEHPGRSAAQIADALQAAVTGISSQLHRGKHTRYEHRNNRWYRRSR